MFHTDLLVIIGFIVYVVVKASDVMPLFTFVEFMKFQWP
jgi:hypothetical protein